MSKRKKKTKTKTKQKKATTATTKNRSIPVGVRGSKTSCAGGSLLLQFRHCPDMQIVPFRFPSVTQNLRVVKFSNREPMHATLWSHG